MYESVLRGERWTPDEQPPRGKSAQPPASATWEQPPEDPAATGDEGEELRTKLRTELRTTQKTGKKRTRHAYDAVAQEAAAEYKRRFREAKRKGEVLPLLQFCDDFIEEKRLALAGEAKALRALPTGRTLYEKLRNNRDEWDPNREYGARPRKAH